jgi:hypothetical protein
VTRVSYAEKLRDPRWQRKRLEVMQRDNFTCRHCFDKDSPLHVHHRVYCSGLDPWDYGDLALVTLCESCHEAQAEMSHAMFDLFFALWPKDQPSGDIARVRALTAAVQIDGANIAFDARAEEQFCSCVAAIRRAMAIPSDGHDQLLRTCLALAKDETSLGAARDFVERRRKSCEPARRKSFEDWCKENP